MFRTQLKPLFALTNNTSIYYACMYIMSISYIDLFEEMRGGFTVLARPSKYVLRTSNLMCIDLKKQEPNSSVTSCDGAKERQRLD
jgi:hypothetical protein